jgi:oxygen-independent coproporphyrinogen-3 oxidase
MLIQCEFKPGEIYNSVHELIRMAYPGCEIISEGSMAAKKPASCFISIEAKKSSPGFNEVFLRGKISDGQKETAISKNFALNVPLEARSNEAKRLTQVFTYKLLSQHLEKNINDYGILTGVRPVKLVHRYLDQGYNPDKIRLKLQEKYLLKEEKARLLLEIAGNNRPFLLTPEAVGKEISIYIGIPYCPSRCYYCSFPGAVLKDYKTDIIPFLTSLNQEMRVIGDYLKQQGITVQSIYIGGGTPTVLSEADLTRLFAVLHNQFISAATAEITVEAGRPDTLSLSKLKTLKDAGVTRICINPQTMHDSTLKIIGRNHDQKGVVQSVEWAREADIEKINMDLIVGLPGETIRENTHTAEEILKLKPENITIHTLAVKRGSLMAEIESKSSTASRVEEVQKGVDFFSSHLRKAGYSPYYLYRQKYMRANMENIGYTLPEGSCIYNIQMIEERQTIIGMGGGAASKFVNPLSWTLSSFYNPKNPQSYNESVEKLIKSKVDKLNALN